MFVELPLMVRSVAVLIISFCLMSLAVAQDVLPPSDQNHSHDSHEHDHPDPDFERDHVHSAEAGVIPLWLLGGYSLLIVGASFLGGWIPGRVTFSHTQFQTIISFVGGLMLGIGLLHLFPHAVHELGIRQLDAATHWMLFGVLLMFFLLRAFHFHHHEPDPVPTSPVDELTACDHDHDHDHDGVRHQDAADFSNDPADGDAAVLPSSPDHACHHPAHGSRFGWVGIFVGLGLHTLLDGVALGAAMQADAGHMTGGLFGLGTLLAIVLHKPLDALSITTLMVAGGWSAPAKAIVNGAFASLCPIGALAFLAGVHGIGSDAEYFVGAGLAFSAGVFISISLADLLPEMQFHSHHRLRLSVALLTGVALAWGIGFLEPAHLHG